MVSILADRKLYITAAGTRVRKTLFNRPHILILNMPILRLNGLTHFTWLIVVFIFRTLFATQIVLLCVQNLNSNDCQNARL
jgi:hypothetical protein